jgi:hypothetical protein
VNNPALSTFRINTYEKRGGGRRRGKVNQPNRIPCNPR